LQGKERELILVSYGVADEEYAEAEASFLLSRNRFNVALTRAKKKVIVFCSEQVLRVIPQDQEVLKDAMILREFRQYCNDGHYTFSHYIKEINTSVEFNLYQKGF
jgi:superfamily I DNA and/or RNA helicase